MARGATIWAGIGRNDSSLFREVGALHRLDWSWRIRIWLRRGEDLWTPAKPISPTGQSILFTGWLRAPRVEDMKPPDGRETNTVSILPHAVGQNQSWDQLGTQGRETDFTSGSGRWMGSLLGDYFCKQFAVSSLLPHSLGLHVIVACCCLS